MQIIKRKKPFILLELLIAMSLISLCSTLLVSTPAKLYKKNLEQLYSLELSRLADNLSFQIQLDLPKLHPWDSLEKGDKELHPLQEIQVRLASSVKRSYKCAYRISLQREKEGPQNTFYRLVRCNLYFYENTPFSSWQKIFSSEEKPFAAFKYNFFICKEKTQKSP